MSTSTRTTRLTYAVCGLLAAAAGMAVGHLVAAFVNPAASPVLAIGSTVVDATPTPVKEWAVQTLGTNDKPVLLTTVAVVTALASAGIGLLSRNRHPLANALLVALAALAGIAALLRPASMPQDIVPAVAAGTVGVAVLSGLRLLAERIEDSAQLAARGAERRPEHAAATVPDRGRATSGGQAPESPLDHTAYAPGTPGTPARRSFLLGAAGVTVGAAAVGALGQKLGGGASTPADVTLPAPASALPPLPTGIEGTVKGVSPFRTPTSDFYRVDTALVIPRVDVDTWKLEVDGMVDRPFSMSFKDLLAMEVIEKDITLNCVSNDVGGAYISSTRWLGVRVRDVLERAGIQSGVDQIFSESVDGMTISTPVEALTDDRDALIAIAMDGQPLPARHGFPARLVTPGLYGFVGATKWLSKLTATTYAKDKAYWTERDWVTDAPVKTQSRIDTPMGLGTYKPGKIPVGGVAWAQAGDGISEVEVRIDDGPWQKATLGPDGGTTYWRQWSWVWDATSGRHDVTVRATNGKGEVQTDRRTDPFPGGASGYHSIVVIVS
ncbi:molybdopterin-dependent oxidoreductase [Phycicoccus sp. 3266]|uniref:molybdopterin-dependent oxidoreductase n=1 Tax=Phycicoccus sp. 3266 TaxID=2817751 RepID=UPI00286387D9|nr:molybdopterin-dependent oxidoreductase [Phycicoccus sp. 3266]MDR6862990.1 DMSO/TMAO reductase YedYZ molybdopterin-dependent catalytic subunit [Phycicoccus sp. 3266]